jgi:oxygen-independent coproporphyrinogen-3 oxidase
MEQPACLSSETVSPPEAALPPWDWPRAAYIHVPFCAHHCGYCDFAVVAGQDHLIARYLEALAQELASLEQPQPVQTLYLGGGTPTHLSPADLEKLLTLVRKWFRLAPGGEFSVEANPARLTPDKIAVLASFGVNRLSLGAQSFQPPLLRFLERDHEPADIRRAACWARERIPSLSLDLIFGIPGQDLSLWEADLRAALALEPDHLSTYGLTYEKGTPLWRRRQQGLVQPLDEESERQLYERAMDLLAEAGFEHYEISNFARPGKRCRHNQVYWANEAYWGFGLGAARYVRGTREVNTRHLGTYFQRLASGRSPVCQRETLPPRERARETLALQLRRSDGVCRADFRRQTGLEADELAAPLLRRFVASGHLCDTGARFFLTREGRCLADTLLSRLWQEN